MAQKVKKTEKKNWLEAAMGAVEKVGNMLPHPFWLFASLALITVVLSAVLSAINWSASYETVVDGAIQTANVSVVNLMTFDTLAHYMTNFISIFMNYYPLGMLILMTIGVGYAEKLGLFDALMRKAVVGAPIMIVFITVAFVGVNSSIGFGAGVVFTMVIAAAVFKSLGLHPWIGIIMGYAAANGGYTACLLPTATDTALCGVSAQIVEANGIVDAAGVAPPTHAMVNYYFIFAATFLITAACVLVTKYITTPYLNRQHPELTYNKDASELNKMAISASEARGLKWAGITTVLYVVILVVSCIPKNSFMRAEDGTLIPNSPLLNMIIPLLFLFFLVVGTAYGVGSGGIKMWKDIPLMMEKCLDMAASFLVVCLTACVFVDLFSSSKIATVLAAKGAALLTSLNVGPVVLFALIILLSCFCNLFITSNSGKWIMLAPFLVPMLSMLDISPAMTQVLYRIGDSTFNILSPVELNVPIALGLLESYKVSKDDKVGLGTLISLEIPYALVYLVLFFLLVLVFYFFNLPLGPGASIFLK
jgi:Putative p-aminobenzoyl-glutamate transporter